MINKNNHRIMRDCTTPRSGAGRYCSYCGAKMEDK